LIEALERNARRGQSPLAFFETGNVFRANANGQSKETGSVAAIVCGPMAKGSWQRDSRVGPADYYTARGIIERISEGLGIEGPSFRAAGNSRFHPGRSAEVLVGNMVSGYVGELHPELTAGLTVRDRVVYFELLLEAVCASTSTANRFKPLFLYPSIVRDLAPRVGIDIPYSSIDAAIDDLKIVILEKCELTDVFSGSPLPEGLKSLTISLTFRSPERTLTDQEVNEALARIRASLETACGASFAG
jgi:phenylalanyl-tRNA synthetase beta chain